MKSWIAGWTLFLCWTGVSSLARGSLVEPIYVSDPMVVSIQVESFLEYSVNRGYVPLKVTVRNLTSTDREWNLNFSSTASFQHSLGSSFPIQVAAQSLKTVVLYVPQYSNVSRETGYGYGGNALNLRVTGPGTTGRQQEIISSSYSGYNSPSGRRHVGMSEQVAATYKESISQNDASQGEVLILHTLDLSLFPQDAKGLSGLDILVLTESEWKDPKLPRDVIARWQAVGGIVKVISPTSSNTKSVGLGSVSFVRKEIPNGALYTQLTRENILQTRYLDNGQYYEGSWQFDDVVKAVKPSFALFMLTSVIIAVLLGPVNLIRGHVKKDALRVVWTTPLWSLGLSVLVGAGIIISDGFGGDGKRSVWVMLLPEENLEVTLQEQVSRTGVLLSRDFTLPPDARMTQVSVESRTVNTPLTFMEQSDGRRGGDWFANRRLQGQVVEQVRSSRAQVTFTPGSGSAPPSVISTVDALFTTIVIQDPRGNWWTAGPITPGEKIRLKESNRVSAMAVVNELANRNNHPMENPNWRDTGKFIAVSETGKPYLDTLKSIDWVDEPTVYTGPLVVEVIP